MLVGMLNDLGWCWAVVGGRLLLVVDVVSWTCGCMPVYARMVGRVRGGRGHGLGTQRRLFYTMSSEGAV